MKVGDKVRIGQTEIIYPATIKDIKDDKIKVTSPMGEIWVNKNLVID